METALSLYELNGLVEQVLRHTLDDEYWVQAELSEVRVAYNGHCYLEFVQKDEPGRDLIAKARGIVWANVFLRMQAHFERTAGRPLAAGMKVLVKVSVTFHPLYGYSLTVVDIDPAYTLGDIARRQQEIMNQLVADGIAQDNKQLALPRLVQRIAVISSENAAGYGDFCNQLEHNDYGLRFQVGLFAAVMQGERVEETMLSALDRIMDECDRWDVVVIIRGGGATSDLSGFDTYPLAAACAQFPLPVITGIGHERDDTVLDLVAHTRVKTPTAAAAFLINHQWAEASLLFELSRRIATAARTRMERECMRHERIVLRLSSAFTQARTRGEQKLDAHMQRLLHVISLRTAGHHQALQFMQQRIQTAIEKRLSSEQMRLQLLQQRCDAANPDLLLRRGYAITMCEGKIVTSVKQLQAGARLETHLADGTVRSVVSEVNTNLDNQL